ncbi:MAG: arginine--tRNA ligase [Patescibacteria group bacterium]
MYLYNNVVQRLEETLKRITKEDSIQLSIPKGLDHGDITSNIAMRLASQYKKNPLEVAKEIVADFTDKDKELLDSIDVEAPGFINFRLSKDAVVSEFNDLDDTYGSGQLDAQKVVIEYSSPNTNKPLHVGHLRNNVLGMSMAAIFEFLGFDVVKTEVVNDRGVHIMKSVLAYKYWGGDETPESTGLKGDAFVAKYYVLFGQKAKEKPELLDEAQDMLKAWEDGDAEVRKLWNTMNSWVYEGWQETYKRYGSEFDVKYYESDLYDKGKEIILDAEDEGLVYKNKKGAYVIDLSEEGLGGRESGEKVLLREDETTVYMTQDIYLAEKRYNDFSYDKMVYVVGEEQKYHFSVLFTILKKLKREWVGRMEHYWYAHVLLPEGRMKSREGTVVDGDDFLAKVKELTLAEVMNRKFVQENTEIDQIAESLCLSAIKYFFLKNNPKTTITFDPKKAIDFEGNTGPYLLYTYVRLGSILDTYKGDKSKEFSSDMVGDQEYEIMRKVIMWPRVIRDFVEHEQHNIIAEYIYQLSQLLNSYYHSTSVGKSDDKIKPMRLHFVAQSQEILGLGLSLLQMPTINKM